ncbi:DUF4871 domain-containing protein [Pseudalkalibacillus hwajinpoensis]|uniref:DUF4871 domain-containing protein n=1 Tax=Guptibacillus hwajinpoensis TaxID=208199 RepID=UPI001CD57BCC|nr:DUF4871 domain-containing protein [Pseudalkalibacillus hwajinpoensis]MCA0989658.1 DUF4871 domain-containing protein [Pseudalkalibacillus hwajinpoensis]
MKNWLKILPLLLIILAGCHAKEEAGAQQVVQKESELEVSDTFTSGSYTLIGEEGRLGFIYGEAATFKAGQPNKYMWHFWGTDDELDGGFKVIGTNQDTNEEVVVFETNELAGAHNGADAHTPSSMQLPSSGTWELDAYVGGDLFGTVVVEVK